MESVVDDRVIVGLSALDDAGVIQSPGGDWLVQTLDFFTPIVDDPILFGMTAAANSLSDVYAMGGKPLSALSIACFPTNDLSPEILSKIVAGAQIKLKEAGCALLGGHTVRDREVKFGFSITGVVSPENLMTKAGAKPGDILVLTKPIGNGILASAMKREALPAAGEAALNEWLPKLNANAAHAANICGVRCATDVTGFGFVGHLYEIVRSSNCGVRVHTKQLPLLATAYELAGDKKNLAGGLHRNRLYAEANLTIGIEDFAMLNILFDPQTSGGLLMAVAPEKLAKLQQIFFDKNELCAVVGEFLADTQKIEIVE